MYIDDDLSRARMKKQQMEEEYEKSLKIMEKSTLDSDEYDSESSETMGISDTSQDKTKISGAEYGVYSDKDIVYSLNLNSTNPDALSAMVEINADQNSLNTTASNTTTVSSDSSVETSENDTDDASNNTDTTASPSRNLNASNSTTTNTVLNITKTVNNSTIIKNITDPETRSIKINLDDIYEEIVDKPANALKIPLAPNYSPDTVAKLQDLINSQSSNETMGIKSESTSEIIKDENESANQMGVVIYTFSDKVTPGLLEYSVITFYISVVFVAGKLLRGYLWGNTEKIYLSELPYPDELLVI